MLRIFTLLSIVSISISALSQSNLNGSTDIFEPSFIHLDHSNDLDYLFKTGKTDDHGFTGGIATRLHLNQLESHNRIIYFSFQTDLFSKESGESFYEKERVIEPILFTEISSISASIIKLSENKKSGYQISGGVGLLNKKKPIQGLGLWIQGGMDGRKGLHKLLDDLYGNSGQEYVFRDKLSPFFYIKPSFLKIFQLQKSEDKIPGIFVSEIGLNLNTNFDAFYAFMENGLRYYLLQSSAFKNSSIKIALLTQADFFLHRDGLNTHLRFGGELMFGRIKAGYERSIPLGNQNINFIEFIDSEDIFRFYLRFRIGA